MPDIRIGTVRKLARYPVKSMAGTSLDAVDVGWHGLAGDRRMAFRRTENRSAFPWLGASHLPELLLYRPCGEDRATGEPLPTHVRTPAGDERGLNDPALAAEIATRFGSAVELMTLRNGVFDDADVSVISLATIDTICRAAGVPADTRRFRNNIVVETDDPAAFEEQRWIGGTLLFSDGDRVAAEVAVTAGDVRCMMVNLDPDTARQDPRVMKFVVQRNANVAGVYCTTVRAGTLRTGQTVTFRPPASG